ncbi:MAG: phosphotransferase [Thermoplasmata archaeon]|nr:phosphotransferase [Thermoplasmata archaeon]
MGKAEQLLFPRMERVEDRRRERQQGKLLDEFFDHATLVTVSRLVNQGQFDTLDYPISTGKEGGVFRATGQEGFRAVKVYRVGNAVFRHLPAYAVEQLRRESSERNYARLIYAWTRREHTILRRLRDAHVPCPEAYGHLRNVLVMEFIGTDGIASPRLQEAEVKDPQAMADDIVTLVRRMVRDAGLVHGDLSPYNLLYHGGTATVIDVAQSIPVEHPQARELLLRDIKILTKYLRKLGAEIHPDSFLEAAGGNSLPARS